MFKINRKIEYALIALKPLRHIERGQWTSAKEICEQHQIPFDPTSRVLQIMNQNGIVQGQQGIQGGYHIKKNLSRVSFRELSDMIVGPIQLTKCMRKTKLIDCKKTSACKIMQPMSTLNEKLNNLFESIKIAGLIQTKIS